MKAKYLPADKEGLRATFTGDSACPVLTCPHLTKGSERAPGTLLWASPRDDESQHGSESSLRPREWRTAFTRLICSL